ncbi:MAG: hypothetical protein IT495_15960 [Gammaproteobacteria bacterium]|nr:hypothetical protein [Gammaproteobacteria bacterium]
MVTTQATLIIPIENQVRELDGKLLLGCAAAERGFRVILGSLSFVEFLTPYLPGGIYLAKSMTPVGQKMLRIVKALGHSIVAWDEETLVRYEAPDYPNWRFSRRGFRLLDHLFAWGQDDAELFARYQGYTGAPVHLTGNPRIDLLRPELREYFRPQVDALNDRYGNFILINTNFAFVNHFAPRENLWQGEGRGEKGRGVARPGRGMSVDFARSQAAHVQNIFDAFKVLLPRLSAWFPDHTIVVRPHSSENHYTWRVFERAHANIRVIHEGNAIPWLMASEVLIHNGCTTAVEAAVLGKPAISYQPVSARMHDYHLPNALSHGAYTERDVRERTSAILAGELVLIDEVQRRRILDRHITAIEGPLAVDRVMDVLEAQANGNTHVSTRSAIAWTVANIRTALKLANMLRPGHRNSYRYHQQRFPHISETQVQQRIVRLADLLGRFEGVSVETYAPYTFSLTARHRR